MSPSPRLVVAPIVALPITIRTSTAGSWQVMSFRAKVMLRSRVPPITPRIARRAAGMRAALTDGSMWNLARKLLFHDRLRFAVAIAGVSISVMLVLVQVGLYFGFMDTASSLIDASRADIWVGKKSNESFEFATPFDERAFYKVSSVPGVADAERVILSFAQFKLADGGDLGVQIVGIETGADRRPLLGPWNVVAGDARRLAEPGAIV